MYQFFENVLIKRIIVFFIFLFFSSCISFSQGIPKVIDNKIYFIDNITQIQMGNKDTYHIFINKNRLVYINQHVKPNYIEYQMGFFDFMGNKVAQSEIITGEMRFIFSETSERILAGQCAMLILQNNSYLYDLNGNIIKVLSHDYETKQIGITEDERYFWFVANRMRPLYTGEVPLYPNLTHTPYNHIMIFDVFSGEFIASYSTNESNFHFTINGLTYNITISPPDFPG